MVARADAPVSSLRELHADALRAVALNALWRDPDDLALDGNRLGSSISDRA